MKHLSLIYAFVFAFALTIPSAVSAYEIMADKSVIIPADEVIDGNLYAAGSNISVDGKVNGDVICAGQAVVINGDVAGSVICAGQSVIVNGAVGGSVRVAGNSINVESNIEQNLMAFGASVILGEGANVDWDMMIGAAFADIKGTIGRSLHGGANNVSITGKVGGNVDLEVGSKFKDRDNKKDIALGNKKNENNFIIGKNAVIDGIVTYKSQSEVSVMSGASIVGGINREEIKNKEIEKTNFIYAWLGFYIYSILSTLLIGFIIVRLWGVQIRKIVDGMIKNASGMIGKGAIIMLLSPVVLLLCLVTIIGIPVALVLMMVLCIGVFVAKLLVGILIGKELLQKYWSKNKKSLGWALVIGVIVSKIIFSIPLIGWLLSLVAVFWGIGAIYMFNKK